MSGIEHTKPLTCDIPKSRARRQVWGMRDALGRIPEQMGRRFALRLSWTIMKDKARWMELCEQAAVEQDPKKLMELVAEINRLLLEKEKRIGIVPPSDKST